MLINESFQQSKTKKICGFTLVEMLATMIIIVTLVSVSLQGVVSSGNLQAATEQGKRFFEIAREKAMSSQTPVRLLINYNSDDEERFLREMVVVYEEPQAPDAELASVVESEVDRADRRKWKILSRVFKLPEGVIFDREQSGVASEEVGDNLGANEKPGQMTFELRNRLGKESWIFYEITPRGRCLQSGSNFSLVRGTVTNGEVHAPNSADRASFLITRTARTILSES